MNLDLRTKCEHRCALNVVDLQHRMWIAHRDRTQIDLALWQSQSIALRARQIMQRNLRRIKPWRAHVDTHLQVIEQLALHRT